jgi:tRNA A-37 threonylcarbamoyl transferase component Bud32
VPQEPVIVEAHGLQWKVAGEFAGRLPLLNLEPLRHTDELADSRLVKDNTVRMVARVDDPASPDGPGLYVKRYKFRDLYKRLLHMQVPTKAHVEWRVSRQLQDAGVPTCTVLAIAIDREMGIPREGWLISRAIPRTVQLRDALQAREPGRRGFIIRETAALTARLVDAAFYHKDYHAGNILVRPSGARGERVFVVDQHSIRRVRMFTRGRVAAMLGMLDNSTRPCGTTEAERTAFLRHFLQMWSGGPGLSRHSLREWAQRLTTAARSQHRRHMRSRTRRCLKESSLFTRDRAGRYRIWHRRELTPRDALRAVQRHDEKLQDVVSEDEHERRNMTDSALGDHEDGPVLRSRRRTQVSIVPCEHVPPTDVDSPADSEQVPAGRICVKAYRRPDFFSRLKDVLRPRSRARHCYRAHRGMQVRGLPVPEPFALLENRWGRADYILLEAIPHEENLYLMANRPGGLPRGPWRRKLAAALARIFCRMAREGISHPDTKPSNFLVDTQDAEVRVWLVDLDRVRFGVTVDQQWWVDHLARLDSGLPADVNLRERLRFLRDCGRGRWSRAERLAIARLVREKSLQRGPRWKAQEG